jgi:multiple sugar transport system permease protein
MAQVAQPLGGAVAATPRKRSRSLWGRIVEHRGDYFYVLPALLVMGLVILYPLIYTIILAFYDTPPTGDYRFVGFGNFVELFQAPLWGMVVQNTIWWTIGSTIFSFILGLIAALLVHTKLPGMRLISGILVIPYVIGQVTAAYAWRWLLHSDFGVLSQTLMQFGIIQRPIPFLQSAELVMPALILVNTWKSFPFAMIMLLAGLQTIPEDLYRAAKVDGANAWRQFWEITLPQLMPVISVTTVLSIIGNMNSFTIPYVMTGGGPAHRSEIVITWVNNLSFQSLRFGYSSAVAVVLFIVLLLFSYFYVRTLATRGGSTEL